MKHFAIVIPCLNEERYIGACLDSLCAAKQEGVQLEIAVVDGMSSDGTREIIRQYALRDERVQLVDNPERVTPVALNLGIKATTADVVAILGAHAEVDADFVQLNLEALRQHPDAGCVGGIIENVHENDAARIISLAMKSPFGVGNARFRTGGKSGFVDTVAFGAYRREVFETIGLFDERLVRNQDDEFNYRLTSAGFKVWFDPRIRSKYYVRGSYRKLARQYRQYGYWKVFVNKLHGSVTTVRQLVPFFFVVFLLAGLALGLYSNSVLILWASGLAAWGVAAMLAALSLKAPLRDVPALIRAFFILHFCYGFGYARGIVDFFLLGKKPDTRNPSVTR